jgi:hypothetical protein
LVDAEHLHSAASRPRDQCTVDYRWFHPLCTSSALTLQSGLMSNL